MFYDKLLLLLNSNIQVVQKMLMVKYKNCFTKNTQTKRILEVSQYLDAHLRQNREAFI